MTDSRMHTIRILLVSLVTAIATVANAAEFSWKMSSREGYIAAPIYLELVVADATDIEPPVAPQIDGAGSRLMPGSRTMTSTTILNGRAQTKTTTTYVFEIVPNRAGKLVVPPVTVRADGQDFVTPAIPFVVNQSETGDLLKVEVTCDPPNPLVGEEALLTLRILARPFRDPQSNVAADEANTWSWIQLGRSELGVFRQTFIELEQRRQRPQGQEELVGDLAYFVYEVSRPWRPSKPGPADLGPIEIVMNWPTATRRTSDFFGRQSVEIAGTRPVTARPAEITIEARPLPEQGRPADFTGAIGRFSVDATAKPTDVGVGDPITVTFRVRSDDEASLEGVRLPPFHLDPSLAANFRIPSDDAAGSIANGVKTFTQTFRPLSDAVKEIPPLRLSFFDPARNEYATAESRPIPIAVSPSERLSLNRIVSGGNGTAAVATPGLTPVAGGLLANASRDETVRSLGSGDRTPSFTTIAAVGLAPPFAVGVVAAILAARTRRERDPLRARARSARAVAERRLARGDADAGFDALVGFLGDRLGLPEGRRTRPDAVAALDATGIDTGLKSRATALLGSLEANRYRPSAAGDDPQSVRAILGELDRRLPYASVGGLR